MLVMVWGIILWFESYVELLKFDNGHNVYSTKFDVANYGDGNANAQPMLNF